MSGAFTLKQGEAGRFDLVFDTPGEKVNKFNTPVMQELEDVVARELKNPAIKLLVVRSGKPGVFVAGADIDELANIKTEAEGVEKSRKGQGIFNGLESLPYPTVALIDGACLGGGMEFALACQFRVVTDNPKVQLGLPEVKLGIMPGWGGSQRLPHCVGLPDAVNLILTGKSLDGKKAVGLGLADKLVSQEFQDEQLTAFLQDVSSKPDSVLAKRRSRCSLPKRLLGSPFGRWLVFLQARKGVMKESGGNYPAPLAALDVMQRTARMDLALGLEEEAQAFSKLALTSVCRNLIGLFRGNEKIKKTKGASGPVTLAPVKESGVLGAGVMGGGIAWLFSRYGHPVRLKDVSWEAVTKGFAEAARYYGEMAKRKKLKPHELSMNMHRISGTLDYTGFRKLDVVVEAIVENMDVKKKVLAELEGYVRDDAILCSNTSALSITEMAGPLKHPERMVGMHFFNPVNRMPLVEVIRGDKSSDVAVATVVALSRELGKSPIVVKDRPGFLVNRILIPYMNEAALLLQEGCDIVDVDKVIEKFGMPMGPFRLADEVGIDVGFKVIKHLEHAFPDRLKAAPILAKIVEKGWLGKKTGSGFYTHKGKKREIHEAALSVVRQDFPVAQGVTGPSAEDVVDRLILVMVREASLCVEEQISDGVDLLDMAMILGTGFPPFRGGVLRYADDLGLSVVVEKLGSLATRCGDRFRPTAFLQDMAKSGKKFYDTVK